MSWPGSRTKTTGLRHPSPLPRLKRPAFWTVLRSGVDAWLWKRHLRKQAHSLNCQAQAFRWLLRVQLPWLKSMAGMPIPTPPISATSRLALGCSRAAGLARTAYRLAVSRLACRLPCLRRLCQRWGRASGQRHRPPLGQRLRRVLYPLGARVLTQICCALLWRRFWTRRTALPSGTLRARR